MSAMTRRALPGLLICAILLLTAAAAVAATEWPSMLNYSIGLSSDEASRIQLGASVSGPLNENFGAKVGGWWILGGDDNRAFVGDAYLDYTRQPLYLAAGRKFIPFGPAGVLVSPGITGGEVQYTADRVKVQAIAGNLSFTPVTGGTRFTFAGNRSPADENITAGRVQLHLTRPEEPRPVVVGLNVLRLLDETGISGDINIDVNSWLSLYGELAEFDGEHANVIGARLSNQKLIPDPTRYTMLVIYHRRIPVGFAPAAVGATQYFEGQDGFAGGVYHQIHPRYGIGVYADQEDVIGTLFGWVPLR